MTNVDQAKVSIGDSKTKEDGIQNKASSGNVLAYNDGRITNDSQRSSKGVVSNVQRKRSSVIANVGRGSDMNLLMGNDLPARKLVSSKELNLLSLNMQK